MEVEGDPTEAAAAVRAALESLGFVPKTKTIESAALAAILKPLPRFQVERFRELRA